MRDEPKERLKDLLPVELSRLLLSTSSYHSTLQRTIALAQCIHMYEIILRISISGTRSSVAMVLPFTGADFTYVMYGDIHCTEKIYLYYGQVH